QRSGGRRAPGATSHPDDHDRRDRRHGHGHGGADPAGRTALRAVRPHRRRAARAGRAGAAGRGGGPVNRAAGRGFLRDVWLQVPFLLWLIALWMLLWAQFTVLSFLTGLVVAVFV